ncbi:family 78 glycoside hydrolase catalytic domain [Actinoplanes sp. NPDC051513]|uniref:alpha-L-rhamnosidase n=1 Tax=Actinoplanes sp. NPDC051513 TaxID=3363908 RepID=UPI0037B11E49
MTPYALTTEQRVEPLGLGEPRPRLSWKLDGDRRGAAQTAYRIIAAASGTDLDDPTRLVWDSGRRDSGETLLIGWDGPALQSGTRYHWRVEVWDETGTPAGAAQTWFETGLLHPGEWTAVWIGRDRVGLPPVDPPTDEERSYPDPALAPLYLRRAFELAERPVRARLYATARGVYEPRLNGERVGDLELAPGWTEYDRRLQYQTYDITGQLRAGVNVVAAIVADGWWSGHVGFDPSRPARHYGAAPAYLAQLVLDFADGSRRVIATDGGWSEQPGGIRAADLLMGQFVDSRREPDGWDTTIGGAGFMPVAVLDHEIGPLVAEPDAPIRVTAGLPAIAVDRRGPDRVIVDFGQNLVGRVRLRIRGAEPGRRIVLRHAEVLADGELYLDNLRRAKATDVYVAAGGDEVFEPQFTFHGFRYAEISGYPGDLAAADVSARVLHNDTPWTGTFACSDPMVEQLQSNIVWGQRGNFVAVPTDCPQRDERLGWLADAQVFAPTATRNADVSAFFARWMRDVVDGQNADGAFRDVAPILVLDREGAPAWGDGGVIIPWLLWRTYGDRRTLEHSFDAMVAWVEHIRRHNPDLLWRHRTGNSYGDWLQVDAETPRDVLATAYFARSTRIVADAAEVLNRLDQAAEYRELHTRIRSAFADAYIGDDGTVEGGTQTAYLMALAFDLMPPELVDAAVDHLAADIEKRGNRLTTGFVGVPLLCPVLSEYGRSDLAYALLHQDEFPSWGYSIRHGATTIWERWDGWTEHGGFQSAAMNSFNHYSLGSIGDWLYGHVAGIGQTPGSVAYRTLLLRPRPGGNLTWARAEQDTARGRVACGWSITDDRLTVTVTVPPGSTAVLEIPTADPGSVREDDVPAADRPGVLGVEPSAAGVTLRLTSGRFTFIANPA